MKIALQVIDPVLGDPGPEALTISLLILNTNDFAYHLHLVSYHVIYDL